MQNMTVTAKYIVLFVILTLLAGCATTGQINVEEQEVALQKANQELPEDQLLDVWIELFDPGELPKEADVARGLSMEIRQAEARHMPVHLRGVMEKTGYWGAVRVVPRHTEGAEVLVSGTILESNGEELVLQIRAQDASGYQWYERSYSADIEAAVYEEEKGKADVFEALYLSLIHI